jgi:PAS domain S-box-containing protein
MLTNTEIRGRCSILEDECRRLRKINEALMNRVEHCTDGGGSSFALFESNLLLHRQIKEHTSLLESINHDLQNQIVIRQKTENALKLERDFISAILDSADVMVIVVDKNGTLVRVNKTCQIAIGRETGELVGKPLDSLFTETRQYNEVKEIFDDVITGEYPYSWESEWEVRKGESRTISWSTTALTNDSGDVEFVISCGNDITEQKSAEETRRVAEQRYRDLIEFLPQTIYERDNEGNLTFVNSIGLKEFGYTIEEFKKGMKLTDIIAPRDIERVLSMVKEHNHNEVTSDELHMIRKDRSVFPAIVYSSPIDIQGENMARRGIVLDISNLREAEMKLNEYRNHLEELVEERTAELSRTIEKLEIEMSERRRAEKALRSSERKYRELVQNANSIILRVNYDGEITFFNEFAQKFFGYSEVEVVGKNIVGTIVPEWKNKATSFPNQMMDLFAHPDLHLFNESENLKKSGERVWISWNNRPIAFSGGQIEEILCVGTDITRRKKAEEALKESEMKYRFLFEDSPACSVIIGLDGAIIDINKGLLNSLNYNRDDLIWEKVVDFIVPEQKEIVANRISGYFKNISQPELDIGIISKSGSIRYLRFSGKSTMIKENELVTGVLISGVDVTKRKEMEELNRRQQEKLVQADKMATLGILVSGVAHEINNPNNFILLNSTNLLDIWKELIPVLNRYSENYGNFTIAGLPFNEIRDDVEPLITGISEGAERIRRIVHSLKDFARKDSGSMDQCFSINEVIETSIIIMNNLIQKSTDHFSIKLDKTIPHMRGNFQQIEQVIINLVTNACQALTDKSQEVEIISNNNPELKEIVVEVCDQGRGVAFEHRKHILDPFFTTKRDSGGTGLGLSISYNIIKAHHGELAFESGQSKGTVFRVTIPY